MIDQQQLMELMKAKQILDAQLKAAAAAQPELFQESTIGAIDTTSLDHNSPSTEGSTNRKTQIE